MYRVLLRAGYSLAALLVMFGALLATAQSQEINPANEPVSVERPPLPAELQHIRDCADTGDARCQYWMGEIYMGNVTADIPVPKLTEDVYIYLDYQAAYEEFLSAAQQRHPKAALEVAYLLCRGDVAPDSPERNAVNGIAFGLLGTEFRRSSDVYQSLISSCREIHPDVDVSMAESMAILMHRSLYGHFPGFFFDE